MAKAKFGVFLPSYAFKGESSPQELYNMLLSIVLECEKLGYDSVWLDDHLMYGKNPMFECWTALAAIAGKTSRIRLGTMVTSSGFRNPAVLAKIASTVDAVSDGRLEFGIGAGVQSQEHEAYGISFPSPKDRIHRMHEAIEIIKAMWTQPEVRYKGKYYTLNFAVCEPKPVQKPHPPITIGGSGEKLTLKITAKYADKLDFGYLPTKADYERKLSVLEKYCKEIGRQFDEIEKSVWPVGQILLSKDDLELQEKMRRVKPVGMSEETFEKYSYIGSPSGFVDQISPYLDLGVTQFLLFFGDLPRLESLRLFAEEKEKFC